MIVYVDTSALIKRLVIEAESEALADYLTELSERDRPAVFVTSALARVEIARHLWRFAWRLSGVQAAVDESLAGIDIVPVDPCVDTAMSLQTRYLRSLDAVHIAAAKAASAEVFITYDRQQTEAAHAERMSIVAPGR